jgi:uncharacterized DUF497 family protein
VKHFDWNEIKNAYLKTERGVSFEDIQTAIEDGKLLDNIAHPNQKQYPGQRILIVELDDYAFLVPFIEDSEKMFLKTIYPSRKFTNKYLSERKKP